MMPLFLLLILAVPNQQAADIRQYSSGWCSPNIVANGPVAVTCIGVDPRALRVLNRKLMQVQGTRDQKIQEANDWANKYHELEQRLIESGNDTELSKQAEEYIHQGEFEKAGAILDEILKKEEKQVDRTAANHYNRGLAADLQFQPLQALPHYELAYRYRSTDFSYASSYGTLLLQQNAYAEAQPVLESALRTARELAKSNPAAYQPNVATALNNLAYLYRATQRLEESEDAFKEALEIERDLAKSNPAAYQPNVATALNNLAVLYSDTQRLKEAEEAYKQALQIRRELAKSNPAAYQPNVATTLNNLAILYRVTQRPKKAEEAYKEALQIRRELAKSNPAAYQLYVAQTLNNLAVLYSDTQRLKEAEQAYKEALQIRRELAKSNPAAYQPNLAETLNNLAILYYDTQRLKESAVVFEEALNIFQELATIDPTYQPRVTAIKNALAAITALTNGQSAK